VVTNAELEQRRAAAIADGWASVYPFYADRARNAEIWDVEGNRHIDFAGGIATLNVGHLHPKVKAAVAAQLERFSHTCFAVVPYEPAVALAERLNALVPGSTPKKTLLVNSGAEAIENAVKIVRRFTGRPGIIAFSAAFHGRTMMAMALTGKMSPYKLGFGPFPGDVYRIPYPYPYRGVSLDDTLRALDHVLREDIEPGRVAAVLVEPVLGEGGFVIGPPELLRRLREVCDRHGIVLVVDEIQTGFGRTGRLFATEWSGIEADLTTMAKSLGGGFPLAAVVGKAPIMDSVQRGGIGGTFSGSPVACAAALAVLEVIEEEHLVERAGAIGELITQRLTGMAGRFPQIGEVRALGAMAAMELVKDPATREPATELTRALIRTVGERGLVLLSAGEDANVIRFLVPLTASDAIVEEGLDIIEGAVADLTG
jgi:4-aminobutyrate aminotransferase / (S)-3-amino-2-methylpropionate transaminase / 5-aminovalerate transaminase